MELKVKREKNKYIFTNEMYPDFKFETTKNMSYQITREIAKLIFQYYVDGFNHGFAKGYYSDNNLYDG